MTGEFCLGKKTRVLLQKIKDWNPLKKKLYIHIFGILAENYPLRFQDLFSLLFLQEFFRLMNLG